jgi:hypothetical protein
MTFFSDHGGDGQLQKYRLYYLGITAPLATVAASIASGSRTVTPSSMSGIVMGALLYVADANGANAETVTVTGTTLTTFTATFANAHAGDPAGTTVSASITAGVQTVTPASMTGIVIGAELAVSNADLSAAETVVVTGVAGATFTATFANAHTINWLVQVISPWGVTALTPYYWTDCDLDIVWNSHTWSAQPIVAGPVNNQPTGATASFKIGDAGETFFPVLLLANGGELAYASIYEAGFLVTNLTAAPDQVLEIYSGRIDRCVVSTTGEDTIEVILMPPAVQTSTTLPTRLIASLVTT